MSSNTISQDPALVKQLFNPDTKADNKGDKSVLGAPNLVRAGLNNVDVPKDQFLPTEQGRMAATRMAQFEKGYQYSESMSLQLTTREGDTVSIDFRQLYSEYQSYRNEQSAQTTPTGVRYFESTEEMESTAFEERFAFSVNGDLNENELKAIFDVFEQVDKLANSFFDGDIEKALAQAMELDIDFGQLQSFQLNLTQTETKVASYQQAAVAEYGNVQEAPESDYGVSMSELPPYLQQWQMSIEKLDVQFSESQKVFDELMSDVVSERFPDQDSRMGWFERVQAFHERLAEYATQQGIQQDIQQDIQQKEANQEATDAGTASSSHIADSQIEK
ncbi:hypothetical protein MNBD_GAMMA04-224 [hydrothermal vent metagenome]|uniref:DUF5610 domain-containing protein n=1 Tax=hydrothermal vent metagenome TaxID=652676 RepID=A0A3B0WHA3_9ZZZZ